MVAIQPGLRGHAAQSRVAAGLKPVTARVQTHSRNTEGLDVPHSVQPLTNRHAIPTTALVRYIHSDK